MNMLRSHVKRSGMMTIVMKQKQKQMQKQKQKQMRHVSFRAAPVSVHVPSSVAMSVSMEVSQSSSDSDDSDCSDENDDSSSDRVSSPASAGRVTPEIVASPSSSYPAVAAISDAVAVSGTASATSSATASSNTINTSTAAADNNGGGETSRSAGLVSPGTNRVGDVRSSLVLRSLRSSVNAPTNGSVNPDFPTSTATKLTHSASTAVVIRNACTDRGAFGQSTEMALGHSPGESVVDTLSKPRNRSSMTISEIMRDSRHGEPSASAVKRKMQRTVARAKKRELKLQAQKSDALAMEGTKHETSSRHDTGNSEGVNGVGDGDDEDGDNEDGGVSGDESSGSVPAPMLSVRFEDGRMVVDTQSQLVAVDKHKLERTLVTGLSSRVTSSSYRKQSRGDKWTPEAVEKLYLLISKYGTDFTIISQFMQGRTRNQIKAKFKIEEKLNPQHIRDVLVHRVPVSEEEFQEAIRLCAQNLQKERDLKGVGKRGKKRKRSD